MGEDVEVVCAWYERVRRGGELHRAWRYGIIERSMNEGLNIRV